MAMLFLYPAVGQTVLDADGNVIPAQGIGPVEVFAGNYYDKKCTAGLLQRADPLNSGLPPVLPPGPLRTITDGDVSAESQGARFDDSTESTAALLAALETMRNKGGRLVAPRTRRAARCSSLIQLIGQDYSGIHVVGGTFKHTTDNPAGGLEGFFTFLHGSQWIEDVTFEHLVIEGNGDDDNIKAVQMGFARHSKMIGLRISNFIHEGLFWPGFGEYATIAMCHAERVGRKDDHSGWNISAYNLSVDKFALFGSTCYDVGSFSESGGRGAVVFGNIFEKAVHAGLMLHSTNLPNELGSVFGNVLIDCPNALYVADKQTSIGKMVMIGNVVHRSGPAVNIGSKPTSNQPYFVTSNLLMHGKAANEAFLIQSGGHVIQANLVARITGTTTGSITSGSNLLTVPAAIQVMHSIHPGSTLTIAGVTGTKTVTAVSADRATITLDSNADATVGPAALVTFSDAKWVAIARSGADDYVVIRDNTFIGLPCLEAFRFIGTKFTLTRNVWETRGESVSALSSVLQWLDVGGGIAHQLFAADMDITQDWTISGTMRSVIYAAAPPPAGTWKVGDIRYVWPPAGGTEKEICTTAGTSGTAPLTLTATTSAGSPNVTLAGGSYLGHGVYLGCKIKIAGEYGGATVTVLSGSGANVVVSANATVGVAGAAVTYSAPVWEKYGPIQAAAQPDSTAAVLADLVADFNALLAKLRTAGVMAP